jgi:hypothetical protein
MAVIKNFSDGSLLEYDQGGFDAWCVYLTRHNSPRRAPLDTEYFTQLVNYAGIYHAQKIYEDFKTLYEHVRSTKSVNAHGHSLILNISNQYQNTVDDALEIEILFTILYAAMVAEEKKAFTKLGAKIKRLGVHQILLDTPPLHVNLAANFSKGKGWRDINNECKLRGF